MIKTDKFTYVEDFKSKEEARKKADADFPIGLKTLETFKKDLCLTTNQEAREEIIFNLMRLMVKKIYENTENELEGELLLRVQSNVWQSTLL